MNNNIYVVGHRNPDSDSICSAIAYANLKRLQGQNAIACRLGPLNDETKFILKKFELENPLLIQDARSQIVDIEIDKTCPINQNTSIKAAWEAMFSEKSHTLPVVNDENKLVGIISTSNLAKTRMIEKEELKVFMKQSSLDSIAKTVDGKVLFRTNEFNHNGNVMVVTLVNSENYLNKFKDSICILSDDVEKQIELIKVGAKCLVITCGTKLSEEVLKLANENQCAIIGTNRDTLEIARIIYEAFPVEKIMTSSPTVFYEDEYVEDVSKIMMKTRFRSYPVLNASGMLVGSISRYHLLKYNKKRFVLVDHSARNQSIEGIEKAHIEEIVDHHHIGNIETTHPIYYRNERCGCTCTIIASLYEENNVEISDQMAGIMLSAIISDTLYFKSTTTTNRDIQAAKMLAKKAGIDLETYAVELLNASVSLIDSTPTDILNRDLKSYEINGYKIAIGQTNYYNIENLQSILPDFKENLDVELKEKQVDLLLMVFTHVAGEGSMFVYNGALSHIMGEVIETSINDYSGYDRHIISRKQQLMPILSDIVNSL